MWTIPLIWFRDSYAYKWIFVLLSAFAASCPCLGLGQSEHSSCDRSRCVWPSCHLCCLFKVGKRTSFFKFLINNLCALMPYNIWENRTMGIDEHLMNGWMNNGILHGYNTSPLHRMVVLICVRLTMQMITFCQFGTGRKKSSWRRLRWGAMLYKRVCVCVCELGSK